MGDAAAARGAQKDRAQMEKMRIVKHGDDDAQHSVTYYTIVERSRRALRGCR